MVCARILEHHEAGVPLRNQAVLFRTGHHSDLLELELAARRIPYVKYGGLRFLEAAHVKDLVALLRLVENPRDELAWFRVLQLLDGVGPATARRITASLGVASVDAPLAPVAALAALPGMPVAIDDLAVALGDASGPTLAGKPGAQVERVRAWLDPLLERRYREVAPRLADLDQLTLAAGAAPSLERFLVDLALDPPASTGDLAGPPHLDDDQLTLSTIHSAKGCEWDVVHVMHLTDGNIPSDMACGDDDEIEEERRLLYVAITRGTRSPPCVHAAALPPPPPRPRRRAQLRAAKPLPHRGSECNVRRHVVRAPADACRHRRHLCSRGAQRTCHCRRRAGCAVGRVIRRASFLDR